METFPTGDAVLSSHCHHVGGKTMFCNFEDISPWNINTGLDASETHHAPVKPLPDQRSPVWNGRNFSLLRRKLILLDSKFISPVLELALSSGITDWAVQGMVDQEEFQGLKPHPFHPVGTGMDRHPLDHRRCARGHGHLRTFYIDQADTAGFEQA
jgi:hypothetical protein